MSAIASEPPESDEALLVDRYYLFRQIASGGMASIHLARQLGPVGFGRTVAIKRLHPHFLKEPAFVAMFVDEAHIMTSIRHPNVVTVLDVVGTPGHLFLVMDYIHGESLHRLAESAKKSGRAIPPGIVSAIGIHLLEGLHAAHEARGPGGRQLDVVHRDVSPQNVLVGIDGLARVADFGIAKAASQLHETTAGGAHKGKIRYMAPEQLDGRAADRRVDIWAAGVVLWELCTLRRLFAGGSDGATVRNVMEMAIPGTDSVFDAVLGHALSRDPDARYEDAQTMALALEAACPPASPREVSAWVAELAAPVLAERQGILDELEMVAKEGMPSLRTQLAVITERASRNRGPLVPRSEPPPSAEDATQAFGGRPGVSTSPPAPIARSRAGLVVALGVVFVLAIMLGLGWHFLGVRI